jgi:transposase
MRTNPTKTAAIIATIGIDIGKTTFHLVGLDKRGAIVLQQKVSRSQLERRLVNVPRCLVGIEALAQADESCQRLMTVPGIGPIISSAVVAAIGNGAGFNQGRDFGAWLGLVSICYRMAAIRSNFKDAARDNIFIPITR